MCDELARLNGAVRMFELECLAMIHCEALREWSLGEAVVYGYGGFHGSRFGRSWCRGSPLLGAANTIDGSYGLVTGWFCWHG